MFPTIKEYHILDTEPCYQFDKLTNIAVKICNADGAFISFFDEDRQWFKSRLGFDDTETRVSNSICQYLIKENLSYLHIPDLSLDETFKEHSAFLDSGARFYAGFPIIAPDHSILGSFCVFGYQPQKLDEVQLEFLKTMAEQTMVLLDMHKTNTALAMEAAQLEKRRIVTDTAAIIGKLGGLYLDRSGKDIFWTPSNNVLFNLSIDYSMTFEEFESGRFQIAQSVLPLFERIRDFCNSQTASYAKLSFEYEANAKVIEVQVELIDRELHVVFHDITVEKGLAEHLRMSEMEAVQTSNNYKSLVYNSTFYICKAGVDGIRTFCNDFYATELGVNPLQTSGEGMEFFHAVTPAYLDYAKEAFFKVASGSEPKRRVLVKETNANQLEVTNLWDFIGLKNPQNELTEVLCLGYDVSELEKNRAEVQMLADYTAFQNKKILEYNSIVSHDIRSHVANAVGLISLMDLITDQDEHQNYFRLLKKEIKKADRTIIALDRFTSLTSVFESGKEPVSLYSLIKEVLELLRKTKPHARFTTVNKIPIDLVMFSVREYLENVFLNVFANSLKMVSPERELQIEIDAEQITNSILQIKIKDNGIGIDMRQYGEELFKIQRPLKDSQYGNGIGLYLVKKQIETLGGRVKIMSENAIGTTIVLEFLNYEE
ncbi:GAF domain-containing sensor histidine kinase [Algoriphagus sp. C2-6-M1]|uniref:GAF domain-containing sensor histidine kinase n=1 Tax=Algoriphagus persicinus TaxID=3108754 RepID=UPI002B3D6383|nr:GAF domain-containing sensor histidine kinase [Algoriphagus sp. C2-6-M1]MEB2782038.1 GAF domain-containing sensor histidine kinase [Algoriphagus sp. C2-6-M1]